MRSEPKGPKKPVWREDWYSEISAQGDDEVRSEREEERTCNGRVETTDQPSTRRDGNRFQTIFSIDGASALWVAAEVNTVELEQEAVSVGRLFFSCKWMRD